MFINSSRLDQTQYSQLNQTRIKIEEIKQKVDYAKDEKLKEQVKKILDEKLKEYGLVKNKIIITEITIPDNYFQEKKNVYNKGCLNQQFLLITQVGKKNLRDYQTLTNFNLKFDRITIQLFIIFNNYILTFNIIKDIVYSID
ncbi:unnamed protein product (macronuclear) [Paramecium tetraurelia]|uniref:Uncharacterized protein n=1 Tax=Paramecium tetraurelia TaxID=5888 RepID=A0C0X3_PARTE|nr:uncharacterized protein GSPATT00033916001 [Paramecium tetraurelia]CAK64440.1 unnamed protein product [Paramecium tetraurelia]|eukprot:XP_001431838.1 hypothetical protein (macronuclear) [Paramecium tetraurelia strain d4-2]